MRRTTYILCLMCRSKLSFTEEDSSHYKNHLKHHHGAYFNHNVILALNLLNGPFFQNLYDEFLKGGHQSDLTGAEDEDPDEVVNDKALPQQTTVTLKERQGTCNEKLSSLADLEEKETKPAFKHNDQDTGEPLKKTFSEDQIVKENVDIKGEKQKAPDIYKELDYQKSNLAVSSETSRTEGKSHNKSKGDFEIGKSLEKNKKLMFSCDECNFSFDKNIKLKKHKQKHKLREATVIKPGDTSQSLYNEEKNSKIKEEKNTSIDECRAIKTKILNCDQCDFTADMNIKLQKHREKNHRKIDKFQTVDKSPGGKVSEKESMLFIDTDKSPEKLNISKENQGLNNTADELVDNPVETERCLPADAKSYHQIRATSAYFKKFPKQIRKGCESDRDRFHNLAPNFPSGWFNRAVGKRLGDKEFLAPDFAIFRSRKAAIEYLKCMECYSQKDIERVERS